MNLPDVKKQIEIFEIQFKYIDKLKDPVGWLEAQSQLGILYKQLMETFYKSIEQKELHRLAHIEIIKQKRLNKLLGMTKKELIEIIMK